MGDRHPNSHVTDENAGLYAGACIVRGVYAGERPRSLPTRGRRCLCARGAQATRHLTVAGRMPEQPSTAGRIGTMFGLQKLQLKNTLLIRCAGIRVRAGGAFVRLHTA